jgi:hypothetical protein
MWTIIAVPWPSIFIAATLTVSFDAQQQIPASPSRGFPPGFKQAPSPRHGNHVAGVERSPTLAVF